MEGGRRMSIREQMTYPFSEAWKAIKGRTRPSLAPLGEVAPASL